MMEKKRQDAPETPVALAEKEIDGICMALRESRNQPLLILYYPDDGGSMGDDDVEAIYGEFRRLGYSKDANRIKELDVLIHTAGGKPSAGYMVAQVLRRFALCQLPRALQGRKRRDPDLPVRRQHLHGRVCPPLAR